MQSGGAFPGAGGPSPRSCVALVCACVAVLTWSLAAPPASAQQDAETQRARAHFEQGVRMIQEGRWADAVSELEAARAIRATSSVLYNLGVALRGVGRFRDAIACFREFIEAVGPSGSAERRADAQGFIDELSAALGTLRITVSPEDADVILDGERLPPGTREIRIDPGPHRARAEASGYSPLERELEMERAGQATIELELVALPTLGTLVVESATTGALVLLDGTDRGAPPLRAELEPGTHRLAVSAPGHRSLEREIEISIGGLLRVQADLTPEGSWLESPVLWIVVGVVVAGGVAATAAGVALSGTQPPLPGDLGLVTGLLRGEL
ncbi:MAG: PEGA domain-containing protein [Sandaracinaceae bacterium]|nr:PEGA domain-containing protein [Sandaracinaceae bacterium]